LTADGQVKLSDFGLGAVKEAAVQHEMLHTVRCCIYFHAHLCLAAGKI
jgi:hypothetical protein